MLAFDFNDRDVLRPEADIRIKSEGTMRAIHIPQPTSIIILWGRIKALSAVDTSDPN